MGMYVCIPHQEKYGLRERPAGTGHAICEICGNLDGDWEVKIPVIYTWDVQRPLGVKDNKQYVLDQLARLEAREAEAVRAAYRTEGDDHC